VSVDITIPAICNGLSDITIPAHHQRQSPSIRVESETISSSSTVRDFGVYIEPVNTVSHSADGRGLLCCTSADLQCSSVSAMLDTLVVSLVLTQLD